MGRWFEQATEIKELRQEIKEQAIIIEQLRSQLAAANITPEVDIYSVTDEERELVAAGKSIIAIKKFRERTGADLITAKQIIESI